MVRRKPRRKPLGTIWEISDELWRREIRCRKSGVSPSFLPEKMRKDEQTPDYAPKRCEKMNRDRITPDTGLSPIPFVK